MCMCAIPISIEPHFDMTPFESGGNRRIPEEPYAKCRRLKGGSSAHQITDEVSKRRMAIKERRIHQITFRCCHYAADDYPTLLRADETVLTPLQIVEREQKRKGSFVGK